MKTVTTRQRRAFQVDGRHEAHGTEWCARSSHNERDQVYG